MLNYSRIFDDIRAIYSLPAYLFTSKNAPLPLRYFFELTYRCNLKCPYCYVGDNRYKNELSTTQWKSIIEQIQPYSFVTLVGGEPLLRQDFVEILNETCKKTLSKVSIVTNGALLTKAISEEIVKNNVMLLSVSLDGYGRSHDENRGSEGLFKLVTDNLENIKSLNNRPKIDIKTIILKDNLSDLVELYKYCIKNNFEFFSLSFLRSNDLKQNSMLKETLSDEFFELKKSPLYFDMEYFKEIYNELESLSKKAGCKIRFAPKFEYSKNPLAKIEEFFTLEKDFKKLYKPCLFPFSNTFVTPEGLVYPCLSVKMGDLNKNTLSEIFNSPCYKDFRRKIKKEGFLSACNMCCELCVK